MSGLNTVSTPANTTMVSGGNPFVAALAVLRRGNSVGAGVPGQEARLTVLREQSLTTLAGQHGSQAASVGTPCVGKLAGVAPFTPAAEGEEGGADRHVPRVLFPEDAAEAPPASNPVAPGLEAMLSFWWTDPAIRSVATSKDGLGNTVIALSYVNGNVVKILFKEDGSRECYMCLSTGEMIPVNCVPGRATAPPKPLEWWDELASVGHIRSLATRLGMAPADIRRMIKAAVRAYCDPSVELEYGGSGLPRSSGCAGVFDVPADVGDILRNLVRAATAGEMGQAARYVGELKDMLVSATHLNAIPVVMPWSGHSTSGLGYLPFTVEGAGEALFDELPERAPVFRSMYPGVLNAGEANITLLCDLLMAVLDGAMVCALPADGVISVMPENTIEIPLVTAGNIQFVVRYFRSTSAIDRLYNVEDQFGSVLPNEVAAGSLADQFAAYISRLIADHEDAQRPCYTVPVSYIAPDFLELDDDDNEDEDDDGSVGSLETVDLGFVHDHDGWYDPEGQGYTEEVTEEEINAYWDEHVATCERMGIDPITGLSYDEDDEDSVS